MINFEETKSYFSQCLHLQEINDGDGWIRFLDIETGIIIGLNLDTQEIALSTHKEEYRNLDEIFIKKLIWIHQAKSANLEQSFKKRIVL